MFINSANFSPYMRELQTFITRVHNDFLSKFNCKKLVAESCLPIVFHSIDRFITQASLVRPLSDPVGKRKLLQDCETLEPALEPILNLVASWNGSAIDKKLKEVAAFKTLLETKTEDIGKINTIIKHSIVLHMLFARAPVEMKYPHESVGWSISR